MALHTPNKLSIADKEKWILAMLHNADKRYNLPIIAHIDLNAKISNMKNL